MAYTAINTADIEVGKPTKKEIFDTIRSNQESFNTDVEALKQTAVFDVFNVKFGGYINEYSSAEIADRIPTFKAQVGGTIVGFNMTLLEASTSGTLEIGLQKSTDNGQNWTDLLTTPVELSGLTVGSVSGAVSWVDIPSQSFNQGDLLRIVIEGAQVDQGEFHLLIYAEVS